MTYLPPEKRKQPTQNYSQSYSQGYSYGNSEVKPERGGCLTTWLVVSSVFAGIAVILLIQTFDLVQRARDTQLPPGLMAGLIALSALIVLNILGLVGIWRWQRWGVYIVAASSIISPIIEVMITTATASDFVAPFVQIAILYYLVRDKWGDFK